MDRQYQELLTEKLPWEKLNNAKLLLTGGNGMIMSSLIDALMEANQAHQLNMSLYVLCRNRERAEERFCAYCADEKFHLLIQDVCQPIETNVHFQYIIHGASAAYPKAFNEVPVDVMKANLLGTLNLLEYSRRFSDTRFMFVSSSEVYGENEKEECTFYESTLGEVDYTRFRACYPESKRASETLCMCYRKQYGTDAVIVRPAFIYGKNVIDSNTRADVYFLKQAMAKQDIVMYSEGRQIRSYCYIKDCISGMLYALLLGGSGEIYNIGNMDCVVTLREYAQELADIAGVSLIYRPDDAPQNMVFLKTTRCVLDTKKLESLGWRAHFSLQEDVRDMLMVKQYVGAT